MITKSKSQKTKQLKYLVLIPLLASMIFYTSCTTEVENNATENGQETMKNVKDNSSGSFKTLNGTYYFNKNKDGSVFIYDRFGNKVDISEINNANTYSSPEIEKVSKNGDVSFAVIDKAPTFPGCSGEGKELKDCFNTEIRKYVAKSFNINLAKSLGLKRKQKIYIKFKITKAGTVEIMGARAPKKELEEEAKRVVNSLPKMIPGEYQGKTVNVTYMLPITFDVQ